MSKEQNYPKNIKEFVEMGYKKNILYRIKAFNLRDSLNNPEDLVSDVLLALMETKYIERYSLEKGSFNTYIYGFIDNLLKKRFNKENTRHGKFIVSAASLVSSSPETDSTFNGREVYAELLDSGKDELRCVEISDLIKKIEEELTALYKPNSFYEYKGKIYARDPATVFKLMMEDKDVNDVAEILGVSRQFSYHLLKKVRLSPTFQEFMKDYTSKNKRKSSNSNSQQNEKQEDI